MRSILNWLLAFGAILLGLVLAGLLLINRLWIGPYPTPFGRGMMRSGYSHSAFGGWIPYGWLIFGAILLLGVLGVLFLAIRSKPQAVSSSGAPSNPLENCPGCGADLEQNWKYCPFCDYELS